MSEERKVQVTASPVSSEVTPGVTGVALEVKGSEPAVSNGNGVAASEVAEETAADVKETNGTSETISQKLNPTTDDKVTESKAKTGMMADTQLMETAAAATPTSAKAKSRRKSGGIPEHKSKKAGKKGTKASNSHADAKPGDYFFIRLKGYPLWPGVVVSEDMLPGILLSSRPVTAARPDGTYREEYEDGGKKFLDRVFPVMYLHTQEFGWIPNYDLVDIDLDEVGAAADKIKNQSLAQAHILASEKHDLQHWKDVLADFQKAIEEELKDKASAAAAKAEAKAAAKGKRKSKTAVDADEDDTVDVEMGGVPEADGEGGEKKPKASKKRKATTDAEESTETPARTDSVKKLKFKNPTAPKTPNGNATPKSTKKDQSTTKSAKSKSKKATNGSAAEAAEPKEPELTPEEKLAKKEKEIMFLRHKLQKGLLTRDAQPKEEEMKQMSDYITKLEEHSSLEVSIMKGTKINKVLKAILKLESIPKEEEFKFKERSQTLLDAWNKILGAEQPTAATPVIGEKGLEKELTNGSSAPQAEDKATESGVKGDDKVAQLTSAGAEVAIEAAKSENAVESTADSNASKPSVLETAA